MKKLPIALASIALSVSLSGSFASAEEHVMTPVLGKQVVSERGTIFVYHEDGTITGLLGGTKTIRGKFKADAENYCGSFTEPEELTDQYEFCSKPRIENGTLVYVRADGSESAPYQIK